MIPYDLIVPSASRPHLLEPALRSVLASVDQRPGAVFVHDDAAFPGKQDVVQSVVASACTEAGVPWTVETHDPPIGHGMTLHRLLVRTPTEYVLYTQDDLLVVRPLPIAAALAVMARHGLHQVRFNKRPTMEYKMAWRKKMFQFEMRQDHSDVCDAYHSVSPRCICDASATVTVADHWYFQTGLWRVARIKPVVDWWILATGESFKEHAEPKVNRAMNREVAGFNSWALANGYDLPESASVAMDPDARARIQKTFIWGPIGEDRYIDNLGHRPEDWALLRPRGGTGPARVDSQAREGNV